MSNWYVGIDPGYDGSLAFYDGKELHAHLMPTTKLKLASGKRRREIDIEALAHLIHSYHDLSANEILVAVIEDVHAMPHQGVVSMFNFGVGLGIVQGCLGAYMIPILKTHPAVWKSQLGLSSDKQKSVDLANKYFPEQKFKPKDDGKAEASLLAKIGFMMHNAKN